VPGLRGIECDIAHRNHCRVKAPDHGRIIASLRVRRKVVKMPAHSSDKGEGFAAGLG
jgi:hypothetical protein